MIVNVYMEYDAFTDHFKKACTVLKSLGSDTLRKLKSRLFAAFSSSCTDMTVTV